MLRNRLRPISVFNHYWNDITASFLQQVSLTFTLSSVYRYNLISRVAVAHESSQG